MLPLVSPDPGLSLCRTERLWVPSGPADGGRDARRVFNHGSAVVCGGHRPVHLPRQQLEAGI